MTLNKCAEGIHLKDDGQKNHDGIKEKKKKLTDDGTGGDFLAADKKEQNEAEEKEKHKEIKAE